MFVPALIELALVVVPGNLVHQAAPPRRVLDPLRNRRFLSIFSGTFPEEPHFPVLSENGFYSGDAMRRFKASAAGVAPMMNEFRRFCISCGLRPIRRHNLAQGIGRQSWAS